MEWAAGIWNRLDIPLSLRGREDCMVWHYDCKGVFSVRNAYHLARCDELLMGIASNRSGSSSHDDSVWKCLWKTCVPGKVNICIWRCLHLRFEFALVVI